jgi:hypothetical protein
MTFSQRGGRRKLKGEASFRLGITVRPNQHTHTHTSSKVECAAAAVQMSAVTCNCNAARSRLGGGAGCRYGYAPRPHQGRARGSGHRHPACCPPMFSHQQFIYSLLFIDNATEKCNILREEDLATMYLRSSNDVGFLSWSDYRRATRSCLCHPSSSYQ